MKPLIVFVNAGLAALLAYAHPQLGAGALLSAYIVLQLSLFASHLFVSRRSGQLDLLDGLNVLNLGFLLHFTLPPFLIITERMPTVYGFLWNAGDMPRSMVLTHAMCVTVQAGYYLRPIWLPPDITEGLQPSTPRVAAFVAVLGVVSAAMGMFPLLNLGTLLPPSITRSAPAIGLSAMTYYLPYYLIILMAGNRTPAARGVVWFGLAMSLFASLFSGIGSKAGVANLIMAFFVYRHFLVKPLRLHQALLAALLAVLVVSYMNYARAVGMLVGLTAETLNPFSRDNSQTFMWAGVASTLTPYEAFLVVLRMFPDTMPFQEGAKLYEDMVYPLFPRMFFPDKPSVYGGAFIWEYNLGYLSLDNRIFEAISLPGHFYMDFGVSGVLVGGVIVGAAQRHLYDWLAFGRRSRGALCLYGMLCALGIISARAFTWTTYTVVMNVLIPVLVIRSLHSRPRTVIAGAKA